MLKKLTEISKNYKEIYIYGFGLSGKWLSEILKENNIYPAAFIDSDIKKEGHSYKDIKVIRFSNAINKFNKSHLNNCDRLIINTIVDIQDIADQLSNHDLFDTEPLGLYLDDFEPFPIEESTSNYVLYSLNAVKSSHMAFFDNDTKFFRSVDLQITERCSMKCKDCSNLMQYYEKPKNITYQELCSDLDAFLNHIDHLFEVRLIGGEPFVHPEAYKLLGYCTNLPKVSYVSIFTNSTIKFNTQKLLDFDIDLKKLSFSITNYGGKNARNLESNLSILDSLNIHYRVHEPEWWTDSGTILNERKTEKEAIELYEKCCGKNLFTISEGRIYRCPFASNADRLHAIPAEKENYATLYGDNQTVLNYLGKI